MKLKLVTNRSDIKDNLKYFDHAINSKRDKKYALNLIKRGTCFVATKSANSYSFYPSRFLGYKDNSFIKHEKNNFKDGRETSYAITKILKQDMTINDRLEKEYKQYLNKFGLTPINKERKFWFMPINLTDETATQKLGNLITEVKKIKPTKPGIKTIPEIFKRPYDENFISDYLAYILNPSENGMGIDPLKKLVSVVDKQGQWQQFLSDLSEGDIDIKREHCFKNKRRIDLLIRLKNRLVIGIENKIWSQEGYKQTEDYFKSIKKELDSYEPVLFFLTPDKNLPKSANFYPLAYSEIIQILKPLRQNKFLSGHAKVLFNDFINYIIRNIMTKRYEKISEKFKLYIRNLELIKDLGDIFEEELPDVFELIADTAKRPFLQNSGDDWEFDFSKNRCYHLIYKKSWWANGLHVHFEYLFSKESIFNERRIVLDVHVEGQNKKKYKFFRKYENKYKKIKGYYKRNDINYYWDNRTLAHKEYSFDSFNNIEKDLDSIFKKSFLDFKFLIPQIDSIMKDI